MPKHHRLCRRANGQLFGDGASALCLGPQGFLDNRGGVAAFTSHAGTTCPTGEAIGECKPAGDGRYAPPPVTEVISTRITGNPDPRHISASYVDRQNLTIRMMCRRFTRLTIAFSRKLANLKAAGISIHVYSLEKLMP